MLFLLFLITLLPAMPFAGGAVGDATTPSDLLDHVTATEMPVPPPLLLANQPPLLDQGLPCTQVLADPSVSLAAPESPWRELRRIRRFADAPARSAPQSLFLREGDEGAGVDLDSVGQSFAVPAGVALIRVVFYYQIEPGSAGPDDALRAELYAGAGIGAGQPVASLSADLAADQGTWRKLDWIVDDRATLSALRTAGQATLAITGAGAPDQAAPLRLWADDMTADVCLEAATIRGQITQRNRLQVDLSDAQILLVRHRAGATELLYRTRPDPEGRYSFSGVPALPDGASYQVWFLNAPPDATRADGRLAFWAGPSLSALVAGQEATLPPFDISDLSLTGSESYARAVATIEQPARLTWSSRGVAGERHRLCLYDPAWADPTSKLPVQLCGPLRDPDSNPLRFLLSPASFANAPGFNFRYGRPYHWYVVITRPVAFGQPAQYGYSFFERVIIPLPVVNDPPSAPSADEPGLPAAPAGPADWTLLVYAAGDNALGDPARAPGVARLDIQLAALARFARRYPQVHIVTYSDLYGDTGARLCYLRPRGGPDCRARAEPNSADPETLSEFVAFGLERYPAQRALLVLAGPGHGAAGFGLDESAPNTPVMPLPALGAALEEASGAAGRPIDLVLLQAPLMGDLDTLAALAGSTRYAVAASDQIWQLGLYDRLLPLLNGASRDNPRLAAIGLVTAYDAAVNALDPRLASSIAAYDLAQALPTRNDLDELGAALHTSLDSNQADTLALLNSARAAVQRYDSSANGLLGQLQTGTGPVSADEDAFFDALGLAEWLRDAPLAEAEVQAAAEALAATLGEPSPLVIATRQRSGLSASGQAIDLRNATGAAVFLPGPTRLGSQATLSELSLYEGRGREGPWARFLRALLATRPAQGSGGITEQFRPPPGGMIGFDIHLPIVAR